MYIADLVARYPKIIPLLQVARLNKPIGTYLLLWPTLSALWIAAGGWPGWHLFLIFVIGTFATRSAGCIINDIADRNLDGRVKRTESRPLATGQLEVFEALIFMAALLIIALLLVMTTNWLTVGIAALGAIVAGIYPLMKRYTYLPQVVLGVAFSSGIFMAFSAVSDDVPRLAFLLFLTNLIWTVAYDTEYAMVDRDDDLKIGIKSTAILFGDMDKLAIGALQALFVFCLCLVSREENLGTFFIFGIAVATGLLIYQQFLIRHRTRDDCFEAFLNNHWVGLAIFLGIVLDLQITPLF